MAGVVFILSRTCHDVQSWLNLIYKTKFRIYNIASKQTNGIVQEVEQKKGYISVTLCPLGV